MFYAMLFAKNYVGTTLVVVQISLTTREQLGINTVGFNYYEREGGKMILSVIPLITTLIASNPKNENFINKIPIIISQHHPVSKTSSSFLNGQPYEVKIEEDGSLGILYITRDGDNDVYNYVRYDTLGNMILDLRNFAISPPMTERCDIEDWGLILPCADYIIDRDDNLWLFYTKGTGPRNKHLCWLKVDKKGKILEKKESTILVYNTILAVPSTNNIFQLYLPNVGMWKPVFAYYNLSLNEPVKTGLCPFYDAFNIIDVAQDKMLVVSCGPYPPFPFKYFIINEKGKIEKAEAISIDSCAFAKIENHGMVFNIDAFHYSDSILVAVSIWTPYLMNKVNAFYLVKFDANGNLVRPAKGIREGKILPAETMPKGIKPSIVLTAYKGLDKLWYYGVDGEGNLYMKKWSREE